MNSNKQGPDFVCIGAQKAGTTWLYDNFVIHPEIWMPPVKEIHFFNTVCPNENLLGTEVHRYQLGLQRYTPLLNNMNMTTLKWLYRYYNHPMSTSWYFRLFAGKMAEKRKAGDITPAYSTLDERGVRFARNVLDQDCKIFIILRNPIERTWSAVKMLFRWRGDDIKSTDIDKLRGELQKPSHKLRSDYLFMVKRWTKFFGNNFKIFYYDDLCADPEAFLYSIQDFIGVKNYISDSHATKKSNADKESVEAPESIYALLMDQYRKDIEELDNIVPGVAKLWLNPTT